VVVVVVVTAGAGATATGSSSDLPLDAAGAALGCLGGRPRGRFAGGSPPTLSVAFLSYEDVHIMRVVSLCLARDYLGS
jgi:hypothetical protein